MSAHIAPPIPISHRFGRKQRFIAGLGATLVLAAAAGGAAWQYGHDGEGTPATSIAPGATHSEFTGRYDTMGGVAEQQRDARLAESDMIGGVAEQLRDNAARAGSSQAVAPHADLPPYAQDHGPAVYLADSQATADLQRSLIQEGNAVRQSMDLPPLNVDVIVITSAEQEAAILRGLGDSDAIRASMGLPGITVIDLRTPAGEAPASISMNVKPQLSGPLPA